MKIKEVLEKDITINDLVYLMGIFYGIVGIVGMVYSLNSFQPFIIYMIAGLAGAFIIFMSFIYRKLEEVIKKLEGE